MHLTRFENWFKLILMATNDSGLKSSLGKLEEILDLYLVKKAPFSLPDNVKEIIVRFAPWIALIVLIVSLPAVLVLFGLGTILMPFSYLGGVHAGAGYTLSLIVLAVSLVIEAIAIPGLMKKQKNGWYLIYYSTLINAVYNLISFNLGGLIIGTLLSLYVLFQIKSYYK